MATSPLPTAQDLEQQLVALISERLLETQPGFGAETSLYDNGLDSMAIMQLLILIEEEFGVSIPEGDLTKQNFGSARQLAALIRERSAQSA